MLPNHSKTQWLKTLSIYYCLKVYRPVGKVWSGPGLAALSWICLCICSQLVGQMGDGWSRMASHTCLMNHYLVTEWCPARSLSLFGRRAQTHSHSRWEGLQEREETQRRPVETYVENWHMVTFTTFLQWKQVARQVQIRGMGIRISSLDTRSCKVRLQRVWI